MTALRPRRLRSKRRARRRPAVTLRRPVRKRKPRRVRRTSRPLLMRRYRRRRARPYLLPYLPYWRTRVAVLPDPPYDLDRTSHRLTPDAAAALRQEGLYNQTWRSRLRRSAQLRRFVNRFHEADGFGLVLRAYFVSAKQRRSAMRALRLAWRLVRADPARQLSFTRVTGLSSRGRRRLLSVRVQGGQRYVLT